MSITPPKPDTLIPIILKSRVPGWVLVAAVVAQFAINQATNPREPSCTIDVQRVHQSTHSREFQNISEAKVKISTECTTPQKLTKLDVRIVEKLPDGTTREVKRFIDAIQRPALNNLKYALFENLTVPCNGKGKAMYAGRAEGFVEFPNGSTFPVESKLNEFFPVPCRISAK